MVLINVSVQNGCPGRWVSLDCKGTYIASETGERNYATALMAASLEKRVSLTIDNEKLHDNYCVATRVDVIF